jgi:hypothetical protein
MVELLLLIIQQLYHFTITVPTTNIENPVFNEKVISLGNIFADAFFCFLFSNSLFCR